MRRYGLVLVLVLLVATGVRFYGLDAKALWLDEALSWRLQSFPIPMLIARTGESTTVHPPLYFILLRFWTRLLGDSEFALRSLSGVAGVLTVLGTFLFVREVMYFGDWNSPKDATGAAVRAGLLASALIGFNAFQICLSQQVRGYTLGTLLLVLSSWALLRALRVGNCRAAPWLWGGYALLALGFCYTHSLALFTVAAQGVFAVLYVRETGSRARESPVAPDSVGGASGQTESRIPRRSQQKAPGAVTHWRGPVLAGALLAVGYLPWVSNLLSQSEAVRTSWHTPTLQIQDYVDELHTAILLTPAGGSPQSPVFAWGTAIALGAVLAFAALHRGWAGWYLICAGCLPVLSILVYCQFSDRNIFSARYFAFAQPMWLAAFACVVAPVRFGTERGLLVCLLLLWSAFSCWNSWDKIGRSAQPGMRGVVAYLSERRSDDERVLAQTPFEYFKLLYYMRGASRPLLCVTQPGRHSQRGTSHLVDADLVTLGDVLRSKPRGLWLVTSDSYDPTFQTEIRLSDPWQPTEHQRFPQDFHLERPITVTHYRRE